MRGAIHLSARGGGENVLFLFYIFSARSRPVFGITVITPANSDYWGSADHNFDQSYNMKRLLFRR